MNFKILLSIIYVISSTYIFKPSVAYAGTVQGCKDQGKNSINQSEKIFGIDQTTENTGAKLLEASLSGTNVNESSGKLSQYAANNAVNKAEAASKIREQLQQCQTACSNPQDENNSRSSADEKAIMDKVKGMCEKELQPVIAGLEQAAGESLQASKDAGLTEEVSRQGGEGGGMSPLMAGLLGAALGAGAAMLLNKKDKDKDKKDTTTDDVVDGDGNVNCSAAGSEAYSDCNDHYVSQCKADLNSDACKKFSNRYCSASSSSSGSTSANTSTTTDSGVIVVSASDKDTTGEGVGSQFCFLAQATSFCSSAGRESCPSCLQLETNKAAVCETNPTLCLAQNSPVEIEAAKNSCPSDPLFSNPDYIAGGGSTIPNDASGLEDPILPGRNDSSYGDSSSDESELSGMPSGQGGIAMASATGKSSSGSNDEMASSAARGSNSYASGSSSGSLIGGGKGVSNSRELASSSQAGLLDSIQRNPTMSGGALGPSLFSMNSALISARCKSRQLAHCSK